MAKSNKKRNNYEKFIRPNGNILIRVVTGYKNNDKRKPNRVSKTFPKGTAKKVYETWVMEQKVAGTPDDPHFTFSDLANKYLEDVKSRIEHNTFVGYEQVIRTWWLPFFGSVKLKDIKAQAIQDHIDSISRKPKTVKRFLIVFRQVMTYGLVHDYLDKKPYDIIRLPKSRSKKVKAWDSEQVSSFKKHISDSPYEQLYLLLLASGLRIGEALGLEPKHVKANSITVEQQKRALDRKIIVPKTLSSFRTIIVPESLIQNLPEGLFIHLSYQQVVKDYKRVCNNADLPYIGLHGLRHTHATLLLSKGINIVLVSRRLGHSEVSITLNTYSHLIKDMNEGLNDAVLSLIE